MSPVASTIGTILGPVYERRRRLFFLATKNPFGHNGGWDRGISHDRLRPTPAV
jgi:hypothetical protein